MFRAAISRDRPHLCKFRLSTAERDRSRITSMPDGVCSERRSYLSFSCHKCGLIPLLYVHSYTAISAIEGTYSDGCTKTEKYAICGKRVV